MPGKRGKKKGTISLKKPPPGSETPTQKGKDAAFLATPNNTEASEPTKKNEEASPIVRATHQKQIPISEKERKSPITIPVIEDTVIDENDTSLLSIHQY